MNHKFQLFYNAFSALCLIGLCFFVFAEKEKSACIDFELLLSKYEGTKVMAEKFDQNTKILRDNMDTLSVELNRDLKEYEKEEPQFSAKERNLRREALIKRQNDLLRYQEAVRKKIEQDREKFIEELTKEIKTYLSLYTKENRYSMVFFKNEQTVAFADEGVDITHKVLEGLNEKYRKKKK